MCPQNRIKHKAAITVRNQCLLLVIAALCFILFCGHIKGALDKFNIIPQLFPKKVGIFIPLLEVLAWVMTGCWVLRSRLTYFWRYMNIFSISIFKVDFNKYTIQ